MFCGDDMARHPDLMKTPRRLIQKFRAVLRFKPQREELHYLLGTADPSASLGERLEWLEKLMVWIRTASSFRHEFDPETGQLHNARIRFFLFLLKRNPEWKKNVAAVLRGTLAETSALTLFSQVGLGQHRGFVAEALDRLFKNALPRPAKEYELSELFLRIFKDSSDALWVGHISATLVEEICDLYAFGEDGSARVQDWHDDMRDALLILSARIGMLGTLPELLQRMPMDQLKDLSLLRLSHFLAAVGRHTRSSPPTTDWVEACLAECEASRRDIQGVFTNLEHSGVSVGLVYVLENLLDTIRRAEILLRFQIPTNQVRSALIVEFLAMLVKDRLSQKTLTDLVKTNLHLIARKSVERTGNTGEHYITRTKAEYVEMIRSGLGGGGMMVLTTLAKFSIGAMSLALFFKGFFYSMNYAFGFVLLHLMGYTLATKQPSATASALAGRLAEWEEDGEVREFVNEVCRMVRSQVAALAGNLLLLIPLSVALDLLYFKWSGHHFLDQKKALHTVDSVHPLKSLSIFYASLTGAWLWVSSFCAGWFENWVVFQRIPEGIASQRRIVQIFGKERAVRIGQWVLARATLLGGNLSLGFLMGFTVVIGEFFGLPIDVRHVTLAAASLTLAVCSLAGPGYNLNQLWMPWVGILLIGFLNFAVSYAFTFVLAGWARSVKGSNLRRLLRAVSNRFRHHPLEFFYPAKGLPSVER